jgi:hypothetical protein
MVRADGDVCRARNSSSAGALADGGWGLRNPFSTLLLRACFKIAFLVLGVTMTKIGKITLGAFVLPTLWASDLIYGAVDFAESMYTARGDICVLEKR